jgi:cell division protein FtsA
MNNNKIIGAVDIGTSKVVALVGEVIGDRSLNIIGFGQSTAQGVRKGEIVDFRATSSSTHAAINAAERNAGATVEAVYLSQSGFHLEGFFNKGSVPVSASDNTVSAADKRHAVESARRKELPPGRLYIHHIQNGFFLDGRPVDDPEKMQGEDLEVAYWHVHGREKNVSDHIHVINAFGLKVEDMIISSIASGSMVASEPDKENSGLVIDIGRGTSDYVLYRDGRILRTGVLCVGGDHLTNDLALGLRVGENHAEKLKLEFGRATINPDDKGDHVWLFGDLTIGDRSIPKLAIYKILQARMEEIFTIIKKDLTPVLSPGNISAGVILTGGVSRLPKIVDVAASVFGVDARVGENPAWVREDLREPEYSTVLGLLYYGLTAQQTDESVRANGGIIRKMAKIFNIG